MGLLRLLLLLVGPVLLVGLVVLVVLSWNIVMVRQASIVIRVARACLGAAAKFRLVVRWTYRFRTVAPGYRIIVGWLSRATVLRFISAPLFFGGSMT